MGVDFDDMRGIARAVVLGKTGHSTLFQLFDPFDLPLKSVADIDGKPRIFGVEDIPLRASLEGVGMGFDEVFKPIDSGIELSHFGRMILFLLPNCFKQCFGNALQGVGVEVGATVEDVGGRSG